MFDDCQDVEKECLMTVRMWKKIDECRIMGENALGP